MIPWLYKYVFRGIGWVLVLMMITILVLTIDALRKEHAPGARPSNVTRPATPVK